VSKSDIKNQIENIVTAYEDISVAISLFRNVSGLNFITHLYNRQKFDEAIESLNGVADNLEKAGIDHFFSKRVTKPLYKLPFPAEYLRGLGLIEKIIAVSRINALKNCLKKLRKYALSASPEYEKEFNQIDDYLPKASFLDQLHELVLHIPYLLVIGALSSLFFILNYYNILG